MSGPSVAALGWPAMAKNRFELVSEVQPDAITLSPKQSGEREVGSVIFPASTSGGQLSEDRVSAELPAVDALFAAIKLANEMKVAIMVMDSDEVWKEIGASSSRSSKTDREHG